MRTLFLIRGLPGVGKSTLAARLHVPHVDADMYYVVNGLYVFDPTRVSAAHAWCQYRTQALLAEGDVAVANTFTRRWELGPYYAMGADRVTEIVVVSALSDDELAARTTHGVPAAAIAAMRARWEP